MAGTKFTRQHWLMSRSDDKVEGSVCSGLVGSAKQSWGKEREYEQ